MAPSVCLVPGILLYFWATYERMRWGAMSAVGVQFLLMGYPPLSFVSFF